MHFGKEICIFWLVWTNSTFASKDLTVWSAKVMSKIFYNLCRVIWMASDRPKYQKRQLFNSQTFMALNGRLHMSTWKFISILKFWKHFWFRYLSLKLCVFRVFHHFHHFYLVTNFRKKNLNLHICMDQCGPKFAFSVFSRTTTNGRKVKLKSIKEQMISRSLIARFSYN